MNGMAAWPLGSSADSPRVWPRERTRTLPVGVWAPPSAGWLAGVLTTFTLTITSSPACGAAGTVWNRRSTVKPSITSMLTPGPKIIPYGWDGNTKTL